MEAIGDFYAELRGAAGATRKQGLPVTVRTLETVIRLSCAAAKCRLSMEVCPN
jgi:DNA replicative helicase MCM subunit Mcm2 (Cdc46/Mcm family)